MVFPFTLLLEHTLAEQRIIRQSTFQEAYFCQPCCSTAVTLQLEINCITSLLLPLVVKWIIKREGQQGPLLGHCFQRARFLEVLSSWSLRWPFFPYFLFKFHAGFPSNDVFENLSCC